MLTVLIPVMTSILRSVASQFITSDEALKWINVAFNVVESGTELEQRLSDLNDRLAKRLDNDQHFGEDDFDKIVAEIAGRDQAWSDL